jgi:hypothetical protein
LLKPLQSFKDPNFFRHLSSKLLFDADIPNLNLNITAECGEDLLLVIISVADKNDTSSGMAQALSQSN